MTDTKSSVQRAMANSPCSVKMNKFKDVRVIGKGQHGTVYQACLNDACKKRFAVKVSNENLTAEHNLTKKFIKMVGKNSAANVYALEKCKSNTRLYSEFLNGQPLKKLLPMLKKDPEKIKPIVHQVLKILKTLHEKNPSFRHNDLHLENIFITTDGKVRIIDFGLSFNTVTKNPEVNINGAYLMPYGIFRGNNKMYDVHFFLNMLPVKYQGDTSTRVHYYRLKPSLNNHVGQGLPTFTKLFNHSYIKGKRLDSMLTAISKPRTVSKPVSTSVQKRKTPPSTETMSAKRRAAAAVLMKSKGTPKKRPGATSKKPPTIPAKSSSKSPNNTETLANLQKRLLTKTRAKPSSIGKVSPTFVKEFMKNMARPKTNLRNRNI